MHSPTPSGSVSKWTQTPSDSGQDGSASHAPKRQKRMQNVGTEPPSVGPLPAQRCPLPHWLASSHGSPMFRVPLGAHATAPVGSTILHTGRFVLPLHALGSRTSQVPTGAHVPSRES